jgi:serine/threonine protein kinase/Tfp pilus assembly protein PilF
MSGRECPLEAELSGFVLGTLPEPALVRVARHLDGCPDCEAVVQALDQLSDPLIAGLRRPLPSAGLPERIGDYHILREIGRGGMGVVYEAEQISLGRRVALKVLPRHALLDAAGLERFRREARAAARLHHTNIVPVFGTGEEGGTHYIAMQLIPGAGLDAVICDLRRLRSESDPASPSSSHLAALSSAQGGSFWASVARLGAQVAEALAYAHGQGLVHRDVKPSNLLLDPHGTVWVTDFGLAKGGEHEDLTQSGELVGTLRYAPPERFRGQWDARGDVYGLGLTLYELLTLRPAYSELDRAALLHQVLHVEPARPRRLVPSLPRDLETVVLKAIARDPARRYQSAAEMADDLRRFADGRPVRARRASTAESAWRWCRRHPREASLGALTAVALLAALAGWAWLAEERAARAEQAAKEMKERVEDRARSDSAVNEALDEAGQLHRESGGTDAVKLAAALAAVRRAAALLPAGESASRLRVERAHAAIAGDEAAVRERLAQAERDRRTARALEEALDSQPSGPDRAVFAKVEKTFRAAFEAHGLALDELGPVDAAEKIKHSAIRRELLGGLDAWFLMRRLAGTNWKRLYDVARCADPDPMRNGLREAIARGDWKALTQRAEALAEAEHPVATLEMVGPILRMAGLTERAIEVLRAAHARHPSSAGINSELALCCRLVAPPRLDEAIRFYTAALALRRSAAVYYGLAQSLADKGEIEEPIDLLRRCLAEGDDSPTTRARARALLGELLLRQGSVAEAAVCWRRLARDASAADAWYNLGLAVMQTKELAEAERAYSRAVELAPGLAEAHANLAFVLQMRGRPAEAAASAERGLKLAASAPELEQLCRLRRDSARRWVELEKQLPALLEGKLRVTDRDRLELAELCASRGRHGKAAELYQEALRAGATEGRPMWALLQGAACAAVAVEGEERARWRRQALVWLRRQLTVWDGAPKKSRDHWRQAERMMRLLRDDAALTAVRRPEALARLPAEERREWERFWGEVDARLKRCERQR